MSSGAGGIDVLSVNNSQLPPLRSLDDFILGSARFQLPNIKDLEKWGNRVVKNLLYYQTNYFLVFLVIYCLMIVTNPVKIICGLIVKAIIVAIWLQFFRTRPTSRLNFIARDTNLARENPFTRWYVLAGGFLLGYILLRYFDAMLLTLFTILLPISFTFVHASLRLRNVKNKVVNAMESLSPSSPMGLILDSLSITAENILN